MRLLHAQLPLCPPLRRAFVLVVSCIPWPKAVRPSARTAGYSLVFSRCASSRSTVPPGTIMSTLTGYTTVYGLGSGSISTATLSHCCGLAIALVGRGNLRATLCRVQIFESVYISLKTHAKGRLPLMVKTHAAPEGRGPTVYFWDTPPVCMSVRNTSLGKRTPNAVLSDMTNMDSLPAASGVSSA